MTPKQRLEAVFSNKVPDRVPHFELVFQLPEAAFGRSWPTWDNVKKATDKEREALLEEFLDIWELIIDRYSWSAVQLPVDFHGFLQGEPIKRGLKRFGDKVMIYDFNGNGTYWMPMGSYMMEFYVKFFERPDEAHEEAKQKAEDSIKLARMQVSQGVDFICINSDYGYNKGPFLSPKMFSEFVTPYLAHIVNEIHKMGVKVILHSDGDLSTILDQLVSTGLDGYQSIDPQGNMDIAEVKRLYGDRLILMGNVKTSMLQDANDQAIRESVRYCMTHGKPGGRYIFSTSNCIFAGMPLESYHIMLDEYNKLADY